MTTIAQLRDGRLRPYLAAAWAEARRHDTDDLAYIAGRVGRRHTLLVAVAWQLADEAATAAEEQADADAVRREREDAEYADYLARRAGVDAASRAAEAAVLTAGWTITYRHGSAGGSLYYWVADPADEDGERYSLRISDHAAPGGGGWNEAKQERHDAPDINIVIRRGADGEYTFDLTPLVETIDQ